MSIQNAVVDMEEYIWNDGGVYRMRGWRAADAGENPVFEAFDEKGVPVEVILQDVRRADVAEIYPQYREQADSLGFVLTIPNLEAYMESHEGLTVRLTLGCEERVLTSMTGEELKNAYREASLCYKLDECTLSGKNILIRGWAVDALGEDRLTVTDENGQEVGEPVQRIIRNDVIEEMHLKEGYPCGFCFTMPREEFSGKKLILSMENRLTRKTYVLSMSRFDYENSKRGKLRKVFKRSSFSKNRKVLKEQGLKGFVDYVREEIRTDDEKYMAWLERRRPDKKEWRRQREEQFPKMPLISIVIPLYNTKERYLKELLDSIVNQSYEHFELCLADGSTSESPGALVQKYAAHDKRIRYRKLSQNLGISENTNEAIRMATGEFLLFADHDDLLETDALYQLVKTYNENPSLDILYTDEDLTNEDTSLFHSPRFKPEFNYDFLRSINYICHLFLVRRSLAMEAGFLKKEYEGAQDYDFILRCCERTSRIGHIPKVLYHWRAHEESTAGNQDSKSYAVKSSMDALKAHYKRMGIRGSVEFTGIFILLRTILEIEGTPKVSILIPNKDQKETLEKCLDSIYGKSTYSNFEVIIIENNSERQETFDFYEEQLLRHGNLKVVTYEGGFNYSAINNFGVRHASGDYLLFLNNDIEIITPGWMEELLGFCQRKGTGAVGGKLYYPDNTVQHAGVVIGLSGFAGHVLTGRRRSDVGYFGRLKAIQDVSAVTAACMMVKRSSFEAVGGFDEDFQVSLNDVDLCMKIRKRGELIVLNPNMEAYHYESKTRGLETTPEKQERFKKEILRFRKKWKETLKAGDPYYSPNLTRVTGDCTLRGRHEVSKVWESLFPGKKED